MSQRRRMGPAPRMQPAPQPRPGHAGRLRPWERVAFGAAFAVMLTFVIAVTISAAHAHHRPPVSGAVLGAGSSGSTAHPGTSSGPAAPGQRQPQQAVHRAGNRLADGKAARATWNRRLAAAMAPVVAGQTGHIAVGVIDRTTGAIAIYQGRRHFHTASIVKADILATLLLQSQHSGVPLSAADQGLATEMIEASDDDAATSLWNLAGGTGGVATANVTLRLGHTTPGRGGYWALTSTTVGDQLTLLTDLTTADSPLSTRSRSYELGLMRDVDADQRWGVPAAASAGSTFAVKNGWLPDPQLWVINSIGVLEHGGQHLLMAVLSNDQPTEAAGIAEDEAAARAAASVITSGG